MIISHSYPTHVVLIHSMAPGPNLSRYMYWVCFAFTWNVHILPWINEVKGLISQEDRCEVRVTGIKPTVRQLSLTRQPDNSTDALEAACGGPRASSVGKRKGTRAPTLLLFNKLMPSTIRNKARERKQPPFLSFAIISFHLLSYMPTSFSVFDTEKILPAQPCWVCFGNTFLMGYLSFPLLILKSRHCNMKL